MTIQFNTDLLDRLIAPGISTFNQAEIPDLREAHDQHTYWLTNHFLDSVFTAYKAPFRQYAFNAIYRIQTAFRTYHEARELTYKYLSITNTDNPAIGSYFSALSTWETCFLNWQILADIYSKIVAPDKAFTANDGSPEQRVYEMCNTVKHVGSAIRRGEHDNDVTVPLWLKNDGFHSRMCFVSYQEFSSIILYAAQLADSLQNPRAFL